jgi:hypothetical protein
MNGMIDKAKKFALPLIMALFLFKTLSGIYSSYQQKQLQCKLEKKLAAEPETDIAPRVSLPNVRPRKYEESTQPFT